MVFSELGFSIMRFSVLDFPLLGFPMVETPVIESLFSWPLLSASISESWPFKQFALVSSS